MNALNVSNSLHFTSILAVSQKRKDKDKIAKETKEGQTVQKGMLDVLTMMKKDFAKGELIKDRKDFDKQLVKAFKKAGVTLDAKLKDALLAPGSLGEKDPGAEICLDKKGTPEPDSDLRDTENVPFPAGISLPLPLDYRGKKKTDKVDVTDLLALVKDHCEDYLKAEVLPYRPDAWIDHSKIKVGYEIPFNRHFYEYEPPRPLEEIEKDINELEKEILAMLHEVTP